MTVSKHPKLPDGDFQITERTWQSWREYCVLWFIDDDNFTADEREAAKNGYLASRHGAKYEA